MKSGFFAQNCHNQKLGEVIVEIGFIAELDGELILMDDGEVICLDQHISPIFKGGEVIDLISKCLLAACDIEAGFQIKKFFKKGVSGVRAGYWIVGSLNQECLTEVPCVIAHVLTCIYGQINIQCAEYLNGMGNDKEDRLGDLIEIFLNQHGGKEMLSPFVVLCGGGYLGEFKGALRPAALISSKKELSFTAIYDGRRLSKRTLFLMGNRNKNFEIFYDQEKFDQYLTALEDARVEFVSVTACEEVSNTKTTLHLCGILPADESTLVTPIEKRAV